MLRAAYWARYSSSSSSWRCWDESDVDLIFCFVGVTEQALRAELADCGRKSTGPAISACSVFWSGPVRRAGRSGRPHNSLVGAAMLGWFHALMPKEQRFFELFSQHSEAVVAGAEALRGMLEGGAAIQRNFDLVMAREHDADNVTRDVLIAVRRTFITPFDRGAIRSLITSMDNGIDQMQKTAKSVILFDVQSFEPEMKEMADAIVQAAKLVREAVTLLPRLRDE